MPALRGVIPALTTPFDEARALDLHAFRRLVDLVIGDGVHGILVGGCTGESWALVPEERAALFTEAVRTAAGRVPVVAGCGALTAREALAKIGQAADAGCAAALVQPPWYVLPGAEEVIAYYKAVAAGSPLPVVVYNIPRRTGVTLSPEMLARIAESPKVIGLKESSKDFLLLGEMIRRFSDRLAVFAGYASVLGLAALTAGAAGYMDSATPVLGRRSVEFHDAAISGDLARARRLQASMAKLDKGFFGTGTFPAGVKAALDMLGRPGGFPREPILPLDAPQRQRIRAALADAALLPTKGAPMVTA